MERRALLSFILFITENDLHGDISLKNARNKHVAAIILAAGKSLRFGDNIEKIKVKICGDTVLCHTVAAFEKADTISSIVIVAKDQDIDFVKENTSRFGKVEKVVSGGDSRAESARLGFFAVDEEAAFVAIHDAARCLVTPDMIDETVRAAFAHGAASLANKVYDTVKKTDADGKISSTVPREALLLAATPQVFSRDLYSDALDKNSGLDDITDDNSLLERIGVKIFPVITDIPNLKITTKEDIGYCEYILSERRRK